jgi:hypothetical protein
MDLIGHSPSTEPRRRLPGSTAPTTCRGVEIGRTLDHRLAPARAIASAKVD